MDVWKPARMGSGRAAINVVGRCRREGCRLSAFAVATQDFAAARDGKPLSSSHWMVRGLQFPRNLQRKQSPDHRGRPASGGLTFIGGKVFDARIDAAHHRVVGSADDPFRTFSFELVAPHLRDHHRRKRNHLLIAFGLAERGRLVEPRHRRRIFRTKEFLSAHSTITATPAALSCWSRRRC